MLEILGHGGSQKHRTSTNKSCRQSKAGPGEGSPVLWAGEARLPQTVEDQKVTDCWCSSGQTRSCRLCICAAGFQSCRGPVMPCYFLFTNKNYSLPLYTENMKSVCFFYITGTRSQKFVYRTTLKMLVL